MQIKLKMKHYKLNYSDLSINHKIIFKEMLRYEDIGFFEKQKKVECLYRKYERAGVYHTSIIPYYLQGFRIIFRPNHKAIKERIIDNYIESMIKKYGVHNVPYTYYEAISNRWKTYNQIN